MATHAEILISLLSELNRFDAQLGHLLRTNRAHVVSTNERIADSFEQIANCDERARRRLNSSFLPPPRRRSRRALRP